MPAAILIVTEIQPPGSSAVRDDTSYATVLAFLTSFREVFRSLFENCWDGGPSKRNCFMVQ